MAVTAKCAPRAGGAVADDASAAFDGRMGLGRALEPRIAEVAEIVAADWLGRQSTITAIQLEIADAMRKDCLRSTGLVSRWLITGEAPTAADTRDITDRGKVSADGSFSMADMTRSYLRWRDAVVRILAEEAALLGVGSSVLSEAVEGIRRGCDSNLMAMVRIYDAARVEMQSELDAQHARMARMALHDPLTGLANRALLLDQLNASLAVSGRDVTQVAVLFLDLDGFKAVNDTFGHDRGDQVLIEVAERLTSIVRPGDTVARMGGDEFVVIWVCPAGAGVQLEGLVRRVRGALSDPPITAEGVAVSVSVGAVLARSGMSAEAVLRAADTSMYVTKNASHRI
jgi:diguanylate cyclase (GGDEF)-like protein